MGVCSFGSIEDNIVVTDFVPENYSISFEKERVIKGMETKVLSCCFVSFSEEDSFLVTSTEDGKIVIFDPRNGSVVQTFDAHEGEVCGVVSGHNGNFCLSCGRDSFVCVWDMKEMKLRNRIEVCNYPVRCIQFLNNRYFAVGCDDGIIRVFDFDIEGNEDQEPVFTFSKEAGEKINCLLKVDDYLLSGGGKFDIFGRLYLWEVNLEEKEGKFVKEFKGAHKGNVNCLEYFHCPLAYKSKGCLVSGGQDNTLIFWEDALNPKSKKSPRILLRVSLSPKIRDKRDEITCFTKIGKYFLLMFDSNGEMFVWNTINREVIHESRINSKKQGGVSALAWIVVDKILAVNSGRFVKFLTVHQNK